MFGSYDEDLSSNPFFVELQEKFIQVFRTGTNFGDAEGGAAASGVEAGSVSAPVPNFNPGLVVCVPRIGSLQSPQADTNTNSTNPELQTIDPYAHLLTPDEELPGSHYFSLARTRISVSDKRLTVHTASGRPSFRVQILFEETFYTEDNLKYKVWCIDSPLNRPRGYTTETTAPFQTLRTFRDCIEYLQNESGGKELLEEIDASTKRFKIIKSTDDRIEVNSLKNIVAELYNGCLEAAYKIEEIKRKSSQCINYTGNIKLAVETCMHHGIYSEVFDALATAAAYDDSHLNKITRNLAEIRLNNLNISNDFVQSIPAAKMCLYQITKFKTVLGKITCLKNTIAAINKKKSNSDENNYLTPDELLPIMIFLVIKSGLPHWHAELNYIQNFRLSETSSFCEASYFISTLEAAIEHLKTEDSYKSSLNFFKSSSDVDSLGFLFEQIKLSDYDKVKEILIKYETKSKTNSVTKPDEQKTIEDILYEDLDLFSELCHPLCACSKCIFLISKTKVKSTPGVMSSDSKGLTILHVASIYDESQIVDLTLELGANMNVVDFNGYTPMHYAASRGCQTALLQLLRAGANVNIENSDKNTPLHLATNNGHDSCVKAIIYYTEYFKIKLDINVVNENGDTPLHMASKWGYTTISRLLLEYGADPWLRNKIGRTAMDIAHSSVMLTLLQSNSSCLNEYVNIINVQKNVAEIIDYSNKKSVLVNLPDNSKSEEENNAFCIEIQSNDTLKQIERLFRAIAYGDVKLSCFYMGLNIDNVKCEENELFKKCHPLCSCAICKAYPNKTEKKFNINICNLQGNTPLHIATRHRQLDICKILIKNNASLTIQNKIGYTPLHIAAYEKHTTIAKLLIDSGSDLSLKDSNKNTPLHLACISGCVEIVKNIIKSGYNTDTTNLSGKNPLDEAKDRMFLTIVALFENL